MELKDLLIVPEGVKQASIDLPSKQQYENDFGKMAFTFLQDRVPQLIPYLVGFEVVEQEPDGAKAVGMFGFSVGDRFYYVPTFFVNNQIKGMESIYDRQSDLMAPLSEEVVNDVINRKTIEIGGAPDEKDPGPDLASPDFTVLTRPPNEGRGSYKYASTMEDLCEVWNGLQKKAVHLLNHDDEFQKMFANAIMAQKGGEIEKLASSSLKVYLTHVGGPEAVERLWTKMGSDVDFARAVATFYDLDELKITDFGLQLAPKKAQSSLVRVVTIDEPDSEGMGDADATKLISQGFTIRDDRDEGDKTEVFSYSPGNELSNPTCSGVYDVALAGNNIVKCMVLMPSVGNVNNQALIVRKVDGPTSFTASSDRVFVLGCHSEPSDLSEAIESQAIPLDQAKNHTRYVLVRKDGKCSSPFRISHASSPDRESMSFRINWDCHVDHEGRNTSQNDRDWVRSFDRDLSYRNGEQELVIHPGKGDVRVLGENYIVPREDWMVMEVSGDYEYGCCPVDSSAKPKKPEERFYPASYAEVTENLIKSSMHELRIDSFDDGSSFLISLNGVKDGRDPVSYKSACVRLVRDYGLPVDDTETILKEASTRFKSNRMIKFGQQVTMPNMQMPPDPYMGDAGIPVQEEWVNSVEGNTNVPPVVPGPRTGGTGEMEQMGADPAALAQEAAAMGQQTVFDHAGIAGLAGTNDVSALVDTFIPTWVEALDKLGRMIFLFYWKNEDFAERYGDDDIADMEDKLRNVYDKFGELIYELKNKTIGAQAGDYI